MEDILSPEDVYDLLVADFTADGHPRARPELIILDAPPAGLGYQTIFAAQGFLNRYVNSGPGRLRYRIGPNSIAFTKVPLPRTVGHLAYAIQQAQVPQP